MLRARYLNSLEWRYGRTALDLSNFADHETRQSDKRMDNQVPEKI